MKKIPLLFLISLIIFAGFAVYSLAQSPPAHQIQPLRETATPSTTIIISPTKSTLKTTNSPVTSIPTTNPSLCIVTVNGQRYDVTQYQYQHSGGNIFTCGTDMSAVFSGQHSQRYLNMMRAYLVP